MILWQRPSYIGQWSIVVDLLLLRLCRCNANYGRVAHIAHAARFAFNSRKKNVQRQPHERVSIYAQFLFFSFANLPIFQGFRCANLFMAIFFVLLSSIFLYFVFVSLPIVGVCGFMANKIWNIFPMGFGLSFTFASLSFLSRTQIQSTESSRLKSLRPIGSINWAEFMLQHATENN